MDEVLVASLYEAFHVFAGVWCFLIRVRSPYLLTFALDKRRLSRLHYEGL